MLSPESQPAIRSRSYRTGLIIAFALLQAAGSFAQEKPPAPPLTPEPICGFQAKHFYYEANRIRQGLSVDCFVGDAQINQPVTLRFLVNQKPQGFPVNELQVEHEKLVHVFGVRDDLSGFFHIHPRRAGPGMWEADYTFTNGGDFQIWSDVKYQGVSYSFAHPRLRVAGAEGEMVRARSFSDREVRSGYEIRFQHPDRFTTGKTNRFDFSIRDAAGNPVETANYLGAAMHLVIIKDDLSVFLHAHPDNHTSVATNVFFSQLFPQPGNYKLFVQFRPGPARLPADEALLAEFYVKVAGAD